MEFLHLVLEYAVTTTRISKHKVEELIYRDELKKNEDVRNLTVKKKVQFESQPLIQRCRKNEKDEICCRGGGKSGTQLKIVMTREEAVRFLSKCEDRGAIQFKDVANELVRLPNNRVQLVRTTTKNH